MPFAIGHEQFNSGRTYFKSGEHVSTKTEFKKGMTPWNKGKKGYSSSKRGIKLSIEVINKIREGMSKEGKEKLREIHMGSKNPMWKGGVTPRHKLLRRSPEFKSWRIAVFERDNYTCQICNERGGKLHPNHIKKFADYPDLRFELSNGVTLCESCHIYKVNRHEEKWERYFISKYKEITK